VAAVREAVGPKVELAIETHAMLSGNTMKRMAERLAKYRMMWYEEPVGPENADTLAALRGRLPVPVCVGERHYTRYGFRPVLEKQAADVIMPDITRCGGPSEMKRIATMADAYNVPIAPHNPNGPLSTLASAHVCASVPNFFRQEFMFTDVPWRDEVIDHPISPMVGDGVLRLSERPGLGVDLTEEVMEAHPGVLKKRKGFYI
jgi:galactonate dehydratase